MVIFHFCVHMHIQIAAEAVLLEAGNNWIEDVWRLHI